MKKRIYNIGNVSPVGKEIWRGDNPLKNRSNITINIPDDPRLLESEKGLKSGSDAIRIMKYYGLVSPEFLEFQSNKKELYIIGSKTEINNFNFPTEILEEYPEYLAGWKTIITNTGLVCFYNSTNSANNFVIYDVFDDDTTEDTEKDGFLDNIKPDISMLKQYDMFNQPLSVRKINFTNNEFTPERSYVYNNKWYEFFNCDAITDGTLKNNSFFEFESEPTVESIQFNYKPLLVFKIYNTNGSKNSNTKIKVKLGNTNIEVQQENPVDPGVYFIDLSGATSFDKVSVYLDSENTTKNGYLEVI